MTAAANVRFAEPEHKGVLAEIYYLYGSHLRLWLLLILPPLLLTNLTYFMLQPKIDDAARRFMNGAWRGIWDYPLLVETVGLRVGAAYLTWIFTVFCFAAVTSAVNRLKMGEQQSASGAYSTARERIGSILGPGTALFLFALAAIGVSTFFFFRVPMKGFWLVWLINIVGLGFVYTFAMSVPAAVLHELGTREALRASSAAFNTYPFVSLLLVGKSFLGGYLAWRIPFWFLAPFLPDAVWSAWAVSLIAGLLVSLMEVMVMIGYTEIYIRYSSFAERNTTAS